MNEERLNTEQAIARGILSQPIPKTDVPRDREHEGVDLWHCPDAAKLSDALEAGRVLDCSEYYGIPIAWRDGDVYRGVLLQYREVTERREFVTANEAVAWFLETARSVIG